MCGIAGFVGRGERADLERMTGALRHRGPDGEGYHVDAGQGVHLGHRRLVVIDRGGGAQPMFNEDGRICVVFNGEIYNHADLRRELVAAGHRFASDHSDTEVLVHGYEEWGERLPEHLEGMFAFVIHDAGARRVFAARDPFGEKPLLYAEARGVFAFASELHALAAHPAVDRSLDPRALQKLFAHGFLPAPNALLRGARKLPAGHRLTLDVDRLTPRVEPYWRFRIDPDDDSLASRDEDSLADELEALLARAVSRRLESDVPLGVFLSGGVDSSAIAALARRARGAAPLATFTVGFDEPSYDESGNAREVARALGTSHHEERLVLDGARELIGEVLGRLDEPLGDASILPTYLLCAFTRSKVTVALSGDGGDELFAGYDPFRALAPAALYRRCVPGPAHRILRSLAGALPRSDRNMSLDFKLRRALAGVSHGPELWNPVWLGPLDPAGIAEVFDDPLPVEELYSEALALWHDSASDSLVDRALEFYTNLYLPDDILTKVDRASMMVSLEVRAPFLDTDLARFCARLPHRHKLRRGQGKTLLRRALRGVVPPAVLARPKKGFGIPLTRWLRELPRPSLAGGPDCMDASAVARRWTEHRSGRADHRLFLWTWMSLRHARGAAGAS